MAIYNVKYNGPEQPDRCNGLEQLMTYRKKNMPKQVIKKTDSESETNEN